MRLKELLEEYDGTKGNEAETDSLYKSSGYVGVLCCDRTEVWLYCFVFFPAHCTAYGN